jgi:hypothetical protein
MIASILTWTGLILLALSGLGIFYLALTAIWTSLTASLLLKLICTGMLVGGLTMAAGVAI